MSCRHCRVPAGGLRSGGELTTSEALRFLEGVAAFARPIVILTGGEPMAREDIYDIARYGSGLGLRMVMAPCGLLMDRDAVRRLIGSGVMRISLSIDGDDRETHDAFRRTGGAFDAVLRAARLAREEGLEFQVNTTVTRLNAGRLEHILELAVSLGAAGWHPFFFVPTGKGAGEAGLAVDPAVQERVLGWIAERSLRGPIQIRPTCAPSYQRVLRQGEQDAGGEPHAVAGGCLAGRSFAFVSHSGTVQPCGFLRMEAGDIRTSGLDLRGIWEQAELFAGLRDLSRYRGACGRCAFLRVCGGCRARAYAASSDHLAGDPSCLYRPAGTGAIGDASHG
jgi:radical SAM protein with 4Fe4S-binding SPASM domain